MFLLDDSLIATLYTVPFLVGLAMPGWRSLAVTGFAAIAVAAWACLTAGGGIGAVLGLFFVLTTIGGLGCGLFARAVTLWIAPLSRYPLRFMAVALVGYILPPVVYSGPASTMAWLKRPSQKVCAAATYRLTAANMTLQLKAAPIFSVDELHAPGSTYVHHFSLNSERGLKEICERELRDNQVIGPAAVKLYPWMFGGSDVQRWAAAICGSASDKTLILVCRLADKMHPVRRMERAAIYGPEMESAVLRHGTYEIENRLHQQLAESKEPYVLVCDGDTAPTADRKLFCGARETTASGLRFEFLFRTNSVRLMADSDAIREYLRELVASLSAGVPS